jgi:hypothetical protein
MRGKIQATERRTTHASLEVSPPWPPPTTSQINLLAALFGNGDAFNSPFESLLFETKMAMFKTKC